MGCSERRGGGAGRRLPYTRASELVDRPGGQKAGGQNQHPAQEPHHLGGIGQGLLQGAKRHAHEVGVAGEGAGGGLHRADGARHPGLPHQLPDRHQPHPAPGDAYAQAAQGPVALQPLLQARGMAIADPSEALFYLQHLNYYRLGAYWLPFEADHSTHQFRPGTRFDDVLNLYMFDRELRLLVLDAIERSEVSLRGQWAFHLAHQHGVHAHLDATLASDRQRRA